MKHANTRRTVTAMVTAGLVSAALGMPLAAFAQANPCAARNPCAAKNPCAVKAIQRPAGYEPYKGNRAELVATGKNLFSDKSLSTNNSSCATCHTDYAAYKQSFAQPYPHKVAMAEGSFGMKQIHLDEMVQLCITTPMAGKPLDWSSKELAALAAYMEDEQKGYKEHLKKNSGAAKNPCAANPPAAPKSHLQR